MKLYATTTSERASKGQGGNDFLEIEVKGEDKRVFLEFKITAEEDHYKIEGWVVHPEYAPNRRSEQYLAYEVEKGKKQKSKECSNCGNPQLDKNGACYKCNKYTY